MHSCVWAVCLQVAQAIPQMSTLLAAVNAAGVAGPLYDSSTAWTILAPTNDAFEDLLKQLGITAAALLADKPLLVKVSASGGHHCWAAAALRRKQ